MHTRSGRYFAKSSLIIFILALSACGFNIAERMANPYSSPRPKIACFAKVIKEVTGATPACTDESPSRAGNLSQCEFRISIKEDYSARGLIGFKRYGKQKGTIFFHYIYRGLPPFPRQPELPKNVYSKMADLEDSLKTECGLDTENIRTAS